VESKLILDLPTINQNKQLFLLCSCFERAAIEDAFGKLSLFGLHLFQYQ
jgi:hypothetical protein